MTNNTTATEDLYISGSYSTTGIRAGLAEIRSSARHLATADRAVRRVELASVTELTETTITALSVEVFAAGGTRFETVTLISTAHGEDVVIGPVGQPIEGDLAEALMVAANIVLGFA